MIRGVGLVIDRLYCILHRLSYGMFYELPPFASCLFGTLRGR